MQEPRLEVTEDILNRVVYGMANQKELLFLDPSDGQLKTDTGDRRVLIPMPEWRPSDGFRLMDGFVGTLPDTPFRRNLFDILNSGSGVFRRFKDALKERPGTEGLWRRYRQREMRRAALSWLSRWSDALELEALGAEPEEWDDLSESEFQIRRADASDEAFLISALAIRKSDVTPDSAELARLLAIETSGDSHAGGFWIAEAPGDMAVGYALINADPAAGDVRLTFDAWVNPDFRGLGIGRKLTEAALDSTGDGVEVSMNTADPDDATRRWLESLGFRAVRVYWKRD